MNSVTTIRCAMSPTSFTDGHLDKGVGMPCRRAHRHALPTGSACDGKPTGGRSIPLRGPGAGRTGIKPAAFVSLNARAFTPLQTARRRALRARLPSNQAPNVIPRRGLPIGGSVAAELSHRAEHAARPCAPRIALLAGAGFSQCSKCFGGRRARSASAGGAVPPLRHRLLGQACASDALQVCPCKAARTWLAAPPRTAVRVARPRRGFALLGARSCLQWATPWTGLPRSDLPLVVLRLPNYRRSALDAELFNHIRCWRL